MSCMLWLAYWESLIIISGRSSTNLYPGCVLPDPSYAAESITNTKLKVGTSKLVLVAQRSHQSTIKLN